MLNNKGFALIEIVSCLVIISLISILVLNFSGYTLSINKEKAYDLMKDNIYKVSVSYLRKCESGQLECNLSWDNNETFFYAENLKESGYFKDLTSPIDGKYLGKCLGLKALKDNGNVKIDIIDNCY